MSETRDIICVTCPMGCTMHVVVADGQVQAVTGQSCKRGIAFAREEVLSPHRMLTTTVTVRNGTLPLAPVRSRSPLPKALLLPAAAELRKIVLCAPVQQGQLVTANILGSGIDIIASRDIASSDAPQSAA